MAVYPDPTSAVDESLEHSYNAQLQYRSNYMDALMGLEGVVPGGEMAKAPDAVMFKNTLGDMQMDKTTRILMPLGGPAVMGDNSVRETSGTELEYLTTRGTINSYAKVVNSKDVKRTLGGHLKGQALFDAMSSSLQDYMQRLRGSFARQGFFDGASLNITSAANGGPAVTAKRPRNVVVWGAPSSATYANGQVVYSSTPATFDANISAALLSVDTSSASVPIVDTFNRLAYTATFTDRIKAIGGDYGGNLVSFIHPGLATFLRDQSRNGSIKNLERTTYSEKIAAKAWTTDLGQLGRNLLIEDACAPICIVNKATGAFSFIYRGTGEDDPRAAYHNGDDSDYMVFHATLVSGKGSIQHTVAQPLLYDDQIRDMNTLVQLGASALEGWQPLEWDEPIAANRSATTRKNQGGLIFLTYAYDLN